MRIGVIGSAGRDGSYTPELFARMEQCLHTFLQQYPEATLVSGGAAGADHLAVRAALRTNRSALIYGPCPWDDVQHQFLDTGVEDWRVNPGKLANMYHRRFYEATGIPSLTELKTAQEQGKITYIPGKSFHQRNSLVADCDILLAFTFHHGTEPGDSGTADTWRKCRGTKYHLNLA